MVELLVVITIIAFLLSISFAVYSDSLENARIQATKTTIRQLDSALQERLAAFNDLSFRTQAEQFILRYNNFGGPAINTDPDSMDPYDVTRLFRAQHLKVAEMIVRKDRFRAAFPQRLEDLWGFDGTAETPDDAPLWAVWKNKTGATARIAPAPDPLESSELLLLALTEGGVFGLPTLPLDSLRSQHVRDDNANGLLEVYDEWNQPLRFYNWPTRLIRPENVLATPDDRTDAEVIFVAQFRAAAAVLMPNIPSLTSDLDYWVFGHPLNQDPMDPSGALAYIRDGEDFNRNDSLDGALPPPPYAPAGEDLNGNTSLDKPRYFLADFMLAYPPSGILTAHALSEGWYHTLNTYSVPLIVSSGPDEDLGLAEPALPGDAPDRLAQPDLANLDQLNDNITSQQR
jgi:type II secretory pathway pseudopilin PulG